MYDCGHPLSNHKQLTGWCLHALDNCESLFCLVVSNETKYASKVFPRPVSLEQLSPGLPTRSVKRSASASPATGSAKAHDLEQKTLLDLAFAGENHP